MNLNLKEVLNNEEFNQFITLLKDIAPYQLKIYRSYGCIEVLKEEEKQSFNQLIKNLKPYYEKLDKAWFT